MNRREFLQASLSCAAVVALPGSLAAADGATVKPRLPIGFLGATYSHGPEKIKLAMTSPDWEFVGVCETSDAGRRTCEKLGARLISQDELFQPKPTSPNSPPPCAANVRCPSRSRRNCSSRRRFC